MITICCQLASRSLQLAARNLIMTLPVLKPRHDASKCRREGKTMANPQDGSSSDHGGHTSLPEPAILSEPVILPGLAGLIASANSALSAVKRGLPPVERWNPPFCGDIDMEIKTDGSWFYMGTPIARPALVRLFASVMVREGDAYFLVTPVEKVGIRVVDAPFMAVEMAIDLSPQAEDASRTISLRTNVDDIVTVDREHALHAKSGQDGGLMPYVHVRRGLYAKLIRALAYDLVALGQTCDVNGSPMFGVMCGGIFHPLAPYDDAVAHERDGN
jgi:uncharacterized protein